MSNKDTFSGSFGYIEEQYVKFLNQFKLEDSSCLLSDQILDVSLLNVAIILGHVEYEFTCHPGVHCTPKGLLYRKTHKNTFISVQDMCDFLSQFKDSNGLRKRGEHLHKKEVLLFAWGDRLVKIEEDRRPRKSISVTKKGRKYLRDNTGLRGFINLLLGV